jgi:hypothetical protein
MFKLHDSDATLLKGAKLTLHNSLMPNSGGEVDFQFPAIIESDNKHVEYTEGNLANIEPLAVFKGSKAREISLKWYYIVTGAKLNNVTWNCKNIADRVKRVRGYFYQTINNFTQGKGLQVTFKAYDIVGGVLGGTPAIAFGGGATANKGKEITFRPAGIDVSYSDRIITDSSGTYAFKTDLKMKLNLWSQGEGDEEGDTMTQLPWLDGVEEIKIAGPDWY